MSEFFKKVTPGDKLKIPAAAYNAFVDAANFTKALQQNTGFDIGDLASRVVLVRNDSGEDRDRGTVLGISGGAISPTDNEEQFKSRIAVVGVEAAAEHNGNYVVLLEPIGDGKYGKACIWGVCPAQVNITDETHKYAETAAGEDNLQSACYGSARILYREPGTGVRWAMVRIGNSSGQLWCPSFFVQCRKTTPIANTWYGVQTSNVFLVQYNLSSPFNLAGSPLYPFWVKCRHDGILRGLSVSYVAPTIGASYNQFVFAPEIHGKTDYMYDYAGCPETNSISEDGTGCYQAINTVDGSMAVYQGDLISLRFKATTLTGGETFLGVAACDVTLDIERIG